MTGGGFANRKRERDWVWRAQGSVKREKALICQAGPVDQQCLGRLGPPGALSPEHSLVSSLAGKCSLPTPGSG